MNSWGFALTGGLMVLTILVSLYARSSSASTTEFYLANRRVGFLTNASAICGDYFSAASFLGVAGAVYASGLDGLWFGAGFGAAFVPMVIFFASPVRRFGEYTVPDFLAVRFQSSAARIAGFLAVQAIALFYLTPQMVGAGSTWQILVGRGFLGLSPYATGVVASTLVMMVYVGIGGMKGTTWNQMFQFWVLVSAMALVAGLGLAYGFSYSRALADISRGPLTAPAAFRVADLTRTDPATGRSAAGEARGVMSREYWDTKIAPKLGDPDETVVVLMPQISRLTGQPVRFVEPGQSYGLVDQFSAILTMVIGASGLPHILNRYYTNPSGRAARTTTVYVLVFTTIFYLLASTAGVIGRSLIPVLSRGTFGPFGSPGPFGPAGPESLAASIGMVDGVLVKPDAVLPFLGQSLGGGIGLGYVAAGAFSAMFSTIGGLLIASAASWGHDLYEQYIDPRAPEWKKVAVGRAAVFFMSLVALALGLIVPKIGLTRAYQASIALMVTWAFAVAGGTFVPVLLTSIWWKRTTLRGALAGMAVGGGGSITMILLNVLRTTGAITPGSLAYQIGGLTFPTIITFPAALLTIAAVSCLDPALPSNVDEIWVRIHGTAKERQERRLEMANGRSTSNRTNGSGSKWI